MVVRCAESDKFYYVLLATKWSICVWALDAMPDRGESCFVFAGRFDDASEISVVSLQRFTCFDYSMQLLRSDSAPMWIIHLDRGYELIHYAVRLYLHAATRETLQHVMRALGVESRGVATNLQRHFVILDRCHDIPQDDKDACAARAEARAAKRKRKAKSNAGGETCNEDASEGSSGSEGDSRVDPSDLRIPPVLLATAAKEVAFVCGRASPADALNEEEDDEGIEEASKLTRKMGATSKRARTEADEPPTPRGHQDSPRI